jgi:hypothetical protein
MHDIDLWHLPLGSISMRTRAQSEWFLAQHERKPPLSWLNASASRMILRSCHSGWLVAIPESIGLWPHASFPQLMTLIDHGSPLPEWLRFVVALNLFESIGTAASMEEPTIDRRGLIGLLQVLLLQPCDRSWVQSVDANRLWRQYREDEVTEQRFALCLSPHPFIYKNVLRTLCTELARKDTDALVTKVITGRLEEFLRCDSERDGKTTFHHRNDRWIQSWLHTPHREPNLRQSDAAAEWGTTRQMTLSKA